MSNPRKSPCYYTFEEWKEIYRRLEEKRLQQVSLASQASLDVTQNSSLLSLKELFISLTVAPSKAPLDTSFSNQKKEIIFAQGHRLCLEGPFDWKELELWLTPLLTKQDEE